MGIRQSLLGTNNDISKTLGGIETEEGKLIIQTLLALQNELLLSLCEHKHVITAYIETIVKKIEEVKANDKNDLAILYNEADNIYKGKLLPFIKDLSNALETNVNTGLLSHIAHTEYKKAKETALLNQEEKELYDMQAKIEKQGIVVTSQNYKGGADYAPQIDSLLRIFDILEREGKYDVRVKEAVATINSTLPRDAQKKIEEEVEEALNDKNIVLMNTINQIYLDNKVSSEEYNSLIGGDINISDAKHQITEALGKTGIGAIGNVTAGIGRAITNELGNVGTEVNNSPGVKQLADKVKNVVKNHGQRMETYFKADTNKNKKVMEAIQRVSLPQMYNYMTNDALIKINEAEKKAPVRRKLNEDRTKRVFELLKNLIITILKIFMQKEAKEGIDAFLKRIKTIIDSVCKYSESQKLTENIDKK